MPPDFLIAMMSRPGERERNEDACGYWGWGKTGQQGPVCCVLADGAGGHGGGDVASQTAAATVLEAFAVAPRCDPQKVRELIELANGAVVARQSPAGATRDMRSTLVIFICDPAGAVAAWGHTGDSRLYCFRGGRLFLHTRDHSLFQSMVEAGMADPAALRGNPRRNLLIASLGGVEQLEADVPANTFPLLSGDAFLICSDGFWEMVEEAAMESALQVATDPQAWIEDLAEDIRRQGRAGQDNYSALAVWFGKPAG